jgi:hypothetical protein
MEDDWGRRGYKNKRGNERQHEFKGGQGKLMKFKKNDMNKGARK